MKNAAAATAIAAAVMMGLFTGAVLILEYDKTERIVGMIAGLLICPQRTGCIDSEHDKRALPQQF